jgi:hypothetical protein
MFLGSQPLRPATSGDCPFRRLETPARTGDTAIVEARHLPVAAGYESLEVARWISHQNRKIRKTAPVPLRPRPPQSTESDEIAAPGGANCPDGERKPTGRSAAKKEVPRPSPNQRNGKVADIFPIILVFRNQPQDTGLALMPGAGTGLQ